jgi:hypothetical protein
LQVEEVKEEAKDNTGDKKNSYLADLDDQLQY